MRHFITGATGFLGSRLSLELLDCNPSHKILALARDSQGIPAHVRLFKQLTTAAEKYAMPHLIPEIESRVQVVVGDLKNLPDLPTEVDCAWHAAASLKFLDRDRDEIYASNVEAVENVTAWLRSNGVSEFNYVSTAYVAGSAEGEIPEEQFDARHSPNNYYEESKRLGEEIVRSTSLNWRILRPSIIIGDSRTFETMSADGMYGFYRNMIRFKERVSAALGDLFTNIAVNLITNPDAKLDFIPVDRCVRGMVAAALGGSDNKTVTHLTNPLAPTMGESLEAAFFLAGMRKPNFVMSEGHLSSIDRELGERVDFYAPYIRQAKVFTQRNAEISALTRCSIPHDSLIKFLTMYAKDANLNHRLPVA